MVRNFLFLFVFSFMCYVSMAQMYVAWNGNVGIGTTSPSCKFQINSSTNNFTFKPSNSGSLEIGGYDGSTNSTITFWHSYSGFNKLIAKSYTRPSDSRLKTNIQQLENPISTIKHINGYSYYYREDSSQSGSKEYGIIAQEVEQVLPELVDTVKGIKVVDYEGLIPFLIEAVKEQQEQIETLIQQIMSLKQSESQCDDDSNSASNKNLFFDPHINDNPQVFQNVPNPFSSTTTIRCFIPENISNAQLSVYDMSGDLVKCYLIRDRGTVDFHIQAGSFSAGVYIYALTCDGQTCETKQMVFTK